MSYRSFLKAGVLSCTLLSGIAYAQTTRTPPFPDDSLTITNTHWVDLAISAATAAAGSANLPSIPGTQPYCGTGGAGVAAGCTGTLVLPNGTAATTPTAGDSSTKVLTTAGGMALLYRNVQTFTTGTANWTKPAFCAYSGITCRSKLRVIGAGGSGGGGSQITLGSLTVGGASGGGGECFDVEALTSQFTSTVSVAIGAGANGGIGATAGVNGGTGLPGNPTTFGTYFEAWNGGGGGKGTTTVSGGGSSGGLGGGGASGVGATPGAGSGPLGTLAGQASFGNPSTFYTHNAGGSGNNGSVGAPGVATDCVSGSGAGGTLIANSTATAGGDSGATIGVLSQTGGATASTGTAPQGPSATGNGALFPATGGAGGGGGNTGGTGGAGGDCAVSGAYGAPGGGGGAGTTAGGRGGNSCGGYVVVDTQGYTSGL